MKKERYTSGFEDVERVLSLLEKQRKKEKQQEWLRKHREEKEGKSKDEKEVRKKNENPSQP